MSLAMIWSDGYSARLFTAIRSSTELGLSTVEIRQDRRLQQSHQETHARWGSQPSEGSSQAGGLVSLLSTAGSTSSILRSGHEGRAKYLP